MMWETKNNQNSLKTLEETREKMNTEIVIRELREAQYHIDKIKKQKEVEMSLLVYWGHIFEHLNFAWYSQYLSDEQIDDLSQEEFEQLSNTIPNFIFSFRLSDKLVIDENFTSDNKKYLFYSFENPILGLIR